MKVKFCLLLTVSLLFVFLGCSSASNTGNDDSSTSENIAAPAGQVYLRTMMWSGSLSISWVYLGNDGTIVFNPKNGVNPVNVAAETANNIDNTGTYKLVGTKLEIKWKNGKTASWSVEKKNGEFTAIDGGLVSKPTPLPANYKLNGTYNGGAVTANLSSSSTLNFKPDGKFTEGRFGAVSTAETGASSSDKRAGTYTITGNTLKLKYNSGETYTAVVGIYRIDANYTYFIINSTSYRQQ